MLLDAVKQARNMHRKAIEQLYEDMCTVTEMKPVKDPVTKITSSQPMISIKEEPCNLIIKSSSTTVSSNGAAEVAQSVVLLLAPELIITPGSRISVMHKGVTTEYQRSGMPIVFDSHQEIALELWKGWT